MLFKDIFYFYLLQPFCSREQNGLCNFGRGHYDEYFCEIILNFDQWLKRRCHIKKFYFKLQWPFCSTEQTCWCNVGRGHYGDHACEIIFNFALCFRRRCHLKIFLKNYILAMAAILFDFAEPFVQVW